VSFAETFQNEVTLAWTEGSEIDPVPVFDTSQVGAGQILHLSREWGLLLVGLEEGGLWAFNAVDPLGSRPAQLLGAESILAVDAGVVGNEPTDQRPCLLAVAQTRVAVVNLRSDISVDWIYSSETGARPSHAALTPTGAVVFAFNESQSSTDVISFRASFGAFSPVDTQTVEGRVGPVVAPLPNGAHFFHTHEAGYILSPDGALRSCQSPFRLSLKRSVVQRGERIYMVAGDSVVVFNHLSGEFVRFGQPLEEPFEMLLDHDTNRLLVADMSGIKMMDALGGDVLWDSVTALGFSLLCGQVRPRRLGGELLVAGSTQLGQQRIVATRFLGRPDARTVADLDGSTPRALELAGTGLVVAVTVPGLRPHGELRLVGRA